MLEETGGELGVGVWLFSVDHAGSWTGWLAASWLDSGGAGSLARGIQDRGEDGHVLGLNLPECAWIRSWKSSFDGVLGEIRDAETSAEVLTGVNAYRLTGRILDSDAASVAAAALHGIGVCIACQYFVMSGGFCDSEWVESWCRRSSGWVRRRCRNAIARTRFLLLSLGWVSDILEDRHVTSIPTSASGWMRGQHLFDEDLGEIWNTEAS